MFETGINVPRFVNKEKRKLNTITLLNTPEVQLKIIDVQVSCGQISLCEALERSEEIKRRLAF